MSKCYQLVGVPGSGKSTWIAAQEWAKDCVVVSTDDEEIAKISKKYGADVPFIRPPELASDTTTFDDVLLHGVKILLKMGYSFDIVAARDCTVPFIDKTDISAVIEALSSDFITTGPLVHKFEESL